MAASNVVSRRAFVAALPFLLAAARRAPAHGHLLEEVEHPKPRPGITGDNVLSGKALEGVREKTRRVFDMAREIPEVADGLYCYCHCEKMGHRSLLTCFESRQPIGCMGCRESMEKAYEMHQAGKTLDEIRTALDREYR